LGISFVAKNYTLEIIGADHDEGVNMDGILPYIFAAITLAGVLYFLYSLFIGGDIDGADVGDGEFTLMIAAAFAAGFGAVGLLGTLSGWALLTTLIVALVFGIILGRVVLSVLRYVMRQQSTSVSHIDHLIGTSARVTIEAPKGAISEAMVEGEYVQKYAVKEVNGAALHRGDVVEVVNAEGSLLFVKKKRL
jgi:membrane protein implicated in regulation of membrane protease activity